VSGLRERLGRGVRSLVFGMVDFGGRRPWFVVLAALALLVASWGYASRLQLRSDVLELLPRDSAGFQSFERRVARIGGRATIFVLVTSPDRAQNERFVDAMRGELAKPELAGAISFIEWGTKDARTFFQSRRWLYADLKDLEEADEKLDRQISIKGGLVEDLSDDAATPERALGMDSFRDRFQKKVDAKDGFPTGYFASPDGRELVMRIFTTASGMGGGGDEVLLAKIRAVTERLAPASFHPEMKIGFGGDIPNAAAEKDSLVHEARIGTIVAAILILGGIVWFYGSPASLVLVGFPPLFGVGCAYAFATWKYGYVNASGAFLGAIILGNGVNYPIVLYSRYKEFRARGMHPDAARREAVWNAFRAELVGSSVASIAYGSLTVTRFRGFSQFGTIGFVGMLLVWISMIPCLPALIVLVDRYQDRLPKFLREKPAELGEDESRGPVARFVGNLTEQKPRVFVAIAAVVTVLACWRLPAFLRDPWEYDFDKLGSVEARKGGPFEVTARAEKILSGKMNLAGSLVLADTAEQTPLVKEAILAKDRANPATSVIDEITTLDDFLPGAPELQAKKLEILERIRERLTPSVLASLDEKERPQVEEMRPPEGLHAVGASELPELLTNRFSERNGKLGTVFYVRYKEGVSTNDGHALLQISETIDGIRLKDGTRVDTVSRATVFAEMIRSLERDGPLATTVAFFAVAFVVALATSSRRGTFAVLLSLVIGVALMLGGAQLWGERLNFLNFIALPITFGIGCEYPFNIFDRSRLLGGDVTRAVKLHLGAVSLCSYTTTVGYGALLFADNQAMRSFGRLAITGELTCLVMAMFFLPSLLHLIGGHTRGVPLEATEVARSDQERPAA
jgi:predicted RND superfamily exporter protein